MYFKNTLTLFIGLLLPFTLLAQSKSLTYYLPDITYDPKVPTPEEFLGYQVGDWHVSHDLLCTYMRELARTSDRVTLEEYARSYEGRSMPLLTITSVRNQENIEGIRKEHIRLCDPGQSKNINIEEMPAVVYQGFSIHGNEASGGNAALLYAYYLAAGQGAEVEQLLDKVVVLLDPVFNPDGFNRFASWVNSHKSKNRVGDPNSRELNEAWPRGRTNHYWFDLNRDWLLCQHPESQGRIRNFHAWKPNILTDHHEMGSNASFFFQPGVPSRTNPLTPERNQELTMMIGRYHAKALDRIESLYYTQESFDDYYYGKGSTYPDVNGCIGILFEQASSRGHLQETDNGPLEFAFTIRNQLHTAMSTLEAGHALRKELLAMQRDFYSTAMSDSKKDETKAYVFGESYDAHRQYKFIELLRRHHIQVYTLAKDIQSFRQGNAYIVPTNQPQYRLIKALFNTPMTFKDSLFYDVSAWTMPMAFNIDYRAVNGSAFNKTMLGSSVESAMAPKGKVDGGRSSYAYCFEWDAYLAPNTLNAILQAGLRAKVATEPFAAKLSTGERDFNYGSIMVPIQNQKLNAQEIYALMERLAQENEMTIYAVSSGLTEQGIDLGSPKMRPLKAPKVLLVVGGSVNSYDAGEVWHLLDQRYDMQVSMVEGSRINRMNLKDYSCIIMVSGNYGEISSNGSNKIKSWVREGGTLIAFKNAIRWAQSNGLSGAVTKLNGGKSTSGRRPYHLLDEDRGTHVIGGAIFETELDLSHPLGFGYRKSKLPVFRRGTLFLAPTKNEYASPLVYTSKPLLSGYISKKNLKTINNSSAIVVSGTGAGRVICMADNPNFRAFWYGTNKLMANAIFFSSVISSRARENVSVKKD